MDLAGEGPHFRTWPQAIAVWSLARLRPRASAATGPSASCKLLGFGCARHAICTACLTNKTHPKALDIHNLLNGSVPDKESSAAHSKLNRRAWNASIQLLSYG